MHHLVNPLVRFLFPFGSVRTVLRGPIRGTRFIVRPAMGLTYAIGIDGQNSRFFPPRVKQGSCVFDIGANRGQMMLLFAKLVGPHGHVVSIEPVPEIFEGLIRNKELNSLTNVSCLEAAVAERTGEAVFLFNEEQSTQGKMRDVEPDYLLKKSNEFIVRTVSVDELIAAGHPPPQIIKIDVEGAAAEVLKGAACCLDRFGPDLYVELHGPEEQEGLQQALLRHRYHAQTLDGKIVTDIASSCANPVWCTRVV